MAKNIEINIKTSSGYEVLYPSTLISQVSGLQNQLNSKLNLSGGTMIGNLILNSNPTQDMQAGNKSYIDQQVSSAQSTLQNNIDSLDGISLKQETLVNRTYFNKSQSGMLQLNFITMDFGKYYCLVFKIEINDIIQSSGYASFTLSDSSQDNSIMILKARDIGEFNTNLVLLCAPITGGTVGCGCIAYDYYMKNLTIFSLYNQSILNISLYQAFLVQGYITIYGLYI